MGDRCGILTFCMPYLADRPLTSRPLGNGAFEKGGQDVVMITKLATTCTSCGKTKTKNIPFTFNIFGVFRLVVLMASETVKEK